LAVRIVVLAFAVAALVAACGGGDDNQAATTTVDESPASTTTNQEPEQDAGAWMKELTERSLRGQYGRNWESLHPVHQAVVTRDRYDRCERADDEGGAVKITTEVVEIYEEPLKINGIPGITDTTAVTLRFSYNNPLTGKPAEEHRTVHTVNVDGEWKWILRPQDYNAYKKGSCPPTE
jgi:hypothetical protein